MDGDEASTAFSIAVPLQSREADLARQIDRAWQQHNQIKDRIPNEAWRRLRRFKARIAESAAVIENVIDTKATKKLVADFCYKKNVGQDRVLRKLRKHLPGAVVLPIHGEHAVQMTWISPSEPLLLTPRDPGEEQPCVLMNFAIAWRPKEMRGHTAFWSGTLLEVPDHACGRLFQRDATADLGACLTEAAAEFLSADAEVVAESINGTAVYVRAGRGCFVCEVIVAMDTLGQQALYLRSRTWLSSDQLRSDQTFLRPAKDADGSVLTLLLTIAREHHEKKQRK